MWELLKQWFKDYFSDPEVAILLVCVLLGLLAIVYLGAIFAPLIAGLVLAYLLEFLIRPCQTYLKLPRSIALWVVYGLFISCVVLTVLFVLPLLWRQVFEIGSQWPNMMMSLQAYLQAFSMEHPEYLTKDILNNLVQSTSLGVDHLASVSKMISPYFVSSLSSIFSWTVYVFLVPLSVIFFLLDKVRIQAWAQSYLPERRGLLISVWREMSRQLGAYVRGKVLEIVLVTFFTYLGFLIFDLHYALLLAVAVGISSVIPYVGLVVVTVPVAAIGLLQYGISDQFLYMMLVYGLIQILDGNVLVPLLFAEAVNLHPIAIIAAVLFFGSVWGFWGLFFAIPLATLVNAIVRAWIGHASHRPEPVSPA